MENGGRAPPLRYYAGWIRLLQKKKTMLRLALPLATLLVLATSCSSKVGEGASSDGGSGELDSGGGDPGCEYFCGNDGRAPFCNENLEDESFSCPTSLNSTCVDFGNCSCGDIPATGLCYEDTSIGVDLAFCQGGQAILYSCGTGTFCDDTGAQAGCFCDDVADGVCPDAICNGDVDCSSCTTVCSSGGQSLECGSNGCGGSCGSCGATESCNSGTCESTPVPPVGESISYTLSGSVTRSVSGQGDEGIDEIFCSYSEVTNTITLVSNIGDSNLEMIIESDPIGFCFFATPAFTLYKFVDREPADSDIYNIDTRGNTNSLTFSCNVNATETHLSATFSSGNLFLGGNSDVFPNDRVAISGGTLECDL